MNKYKYENMSQNDLNREIHTACRNGNIALINYLFSSHELKLHAMYENNYLHGYFATACAAGKVEVVDLLLQAKFNPEQKYHAYHNIGLINACYNGQLETVKYLLTHANLQNKIDIHSNNDEACMRACGSGHLEVLKYILTSADIKEHANIHANNDSSFIFALDKNRHNILNYLVFDYKIKKTRYIKEYISSNGEVKNMFKIRDLNEKLSLELNYKYNNDYKIKL